jgi:hypothetical protein
VDSWGFRFWLWREVGDCWLFKLEYYFFLLRYEHIVADCDIWLGNLGWRNLLRHRWDRRLKLNQGLIRLLID